ncbi:MAG: FAD-binding oxidoreductase [Rhodospirillaceae bacterium]|nr:FAD-binding oxidoreductase [Rhodospirillaceae bacterium]
MAAFLGTKKARKLPDVGARNGWYETLPAPAEALRVQGEVRHDWVVIGAGTCGLAVARRLAELHPDASIAVIEAGRVGHGTSGRNAGFMLSHHGVGRIDDLEIGRRSIRLFTLGHRYLRDIVEQHQIRCDWSDWGQIYVSATPQGAAHLDVVGKGLESLEVPIRRLGQDEMEAVIGSRFYDRGVRLAGSALVQPAAMMRGLGATLPPNVTLYEDSPVTELRAVAGFRLRCPEGEVAAGKLILANHVFAEEIGFARHRTVPIATFASLTRPLGEAEKAHLGAEKQFGLLPASPNGSTVRLTLDGRILMRNTMSYAREKRFDADFMVQVEGHHRHSLRQRWPGLGEVEFISTWGGVMSFTRNEGGIFGEIGDGLYAVMSPDAGPMTRGAAAGKLLAEQIAGIDSEELRIMQSIPKAALLPPDPILRFISERRIKKFEAAEAAER